MAARILFLASAALATAAASPARGEQRVVQVMDEHNRGVQSTVFMNDSGNDGTHLAYTGPDGSARVDLECKVGRRLLARPGNSGRYWESAPQDCSETKPLRVITKVRNAAASAGIQELKLAGGGSWYVVMTPILHVATQTVAKGYGHRGCRIEVSATFQRAIFEENVDGSWRPVNVSTEAPKLVKPFGSEVLSSATTDGQCSQAQEELLDIAETARFKLGDATAVAASWQSYGIARTKGVESVRLVAVAGE